LDLEQVQAERLDLGQHAIQCRPVQQAGEHGVHAVMLRRQRRRTPTAPSTTSSPRPASALSLVQGPRRQHHRLVPARVNRQPEDAVLDARRQRGPGVPGRRLGPSRRQAVSGAAPGEPVQTAGSTDRPDLWPPSPAVRRPGKRADRQISRADRRPAQSSSVTRTTSMLWCLPILCASLAGEARRLAGPDPPVRCWLACSGRACRPAAALGCAGTRWRCVAASGSRSQPWRGEAIGMTSPHRTACSWTMTATAPASTPQMRGRGGQAGVYRSVRGCCSAIPAYAWPRDLRHRWEPP